MRLHFSKVRQLAALVLTLTLAGCGGSDNVRSGTTTSVGGGNGSLSGTGAGSGGGSAGDTGGGSTSGDAQRTPIKFKVNWAAAVSRAARQSRDVRAPVFAQSCVVTLTGAGANGGDFSATFNRNATPEAHSETYTSQAQALVGSWPLHLRFYSNSGGSGDLVGTADQTVSLAEDGSGVDVVDTVGYPTVVKVIPGQRVHIGTQTNLALSVQDSTGNLLAVAPGSAQFALADGGDPNTRHFNAQAQAVADQQGTAFVTATLNGTASAPAPIVVYDGEEPHHIYASGGALFQMDDMQGRNATTLTGVQGHSFGALYGLAIDSHERIYVGSFEATQQTIWNVIYRMDDIRGTNAVAHYGINTFSLALDLQDRLHVLSIMSPLNRLDTFPDGPVVTFQDSESTYPVNDITFDAQGRLYYIGSGNNGRNYVARINDLSGAGFARSTASAGISRIAVDARGRIYTIEFDSPDVLARYDSLGSSHRVVSGTHLDHPSDVAIDAQDRIYVADGARIVRMDDIYGTNTVEYRISSDSPLKSAETIAVH